MIAYLLRLFTGTDFAAWEFNYVKNADPVFATCDIMLADADERCGYNETDDPTRNRMSYVEPMMHYWRDKIDVMHSSNFSKQYSLSFYWSSLTLTTSGQQVIKLVAMLIVLIAGGSIGMNLL